MAAVHSTFQGGSDEPGHLWFSYLEGYSPEFVRQILHRFMPDAKLVLEPFAGTGTTPLTLSAAGVACAYSEINPVLRRVADLKLQVLLAPSALRKNLQERIWELSATLEKLSASAAPTGNLRNSYKRAFGRSRFFDEDQFERVVRLRAVCDQLYREDRLLGQTLEVAVMAKLVTCSRLKRAGDLRYRRPKELARGIPPLMGEVGNQLTLMVTDIDRFPRSDIRPHYICANAKDLASFPSMRADGLITSPPYLNGTNYIRNTRLELWFLRQLADPTDLRTFRDQVVTAGINDVGRNTGRESPTPSVSALAARG